jgi:hypothetical protein
LTWPNANHGIALAQRTLADMAISRQVLKRKLPSGGNAYMLGTKGVAILNTELGLHAERPVTFKLGNPVHRAACNWFLIRQIQAGLDVRTEYEIQSGKCSMHGYFSKIPDGLVLTDQGAIWLEVENAWKNRAERDKIVSFCANHLDNLERMEQILDGWFLFRVEILAINPDAAKNIARSFTEAYQRGHIRERSLHDIWLIYAPMGKGLIYPDAREIASGQMWYDVVLPQFEQVAA